MMMIGLIICALTSLTPLVLGADVQVPLTILESDCKLSWIYRNAYLPKVIVYSTGGTILSASAYSRLDNLAYCEHAKHHSHSARQLIQDVDEVLDIAQIAIVTLPWATSNDLTSEYFVNISRHFAEHGCDASSVAGGVVLHGTSTLAETIFGIDLTLPCDKPIVAVGSMRPQRALSPDAYLNFYQAISTAVSPSSQQRGALIVANDHITSAYYATKAHANNPDTFMALEQGHLGYLFAGQPYYFYEPARPTGKRHFDLSLIPKGHLPKVDILYGHLEFDAALMRAAVEAGSRGIVIVGVGAGDLNHAGMVMAEELATEGIPIIVAARPFTGSSFPDVHRNAKIKTNFMSTEHARIQLQLCIGMGMDLDEIRDSFEAPFRQAVYNAGTAFYDRY